MRGQSDRGTIRLWMPGRNCELLFFFLFMRTNHLRIDCQFHLMIHLVEDARLET